MKKFSILVFSMMLALAFISCSSAQKQDLKNTATSEAVKKAEEVAKEDPCKADCGKAYDTCMTKAGKSKAKANKCEADKKKCITKCDKPAKAPAKKK